MQPYRVVAINEAAVHEQRELAAFAEGFRRQRNIARRRVIGACALGVLVLFGASAYVMAFEPPRSTIGVRSSCSDETCLCWHEDAHVWARVDCSPEPVGTCFKSLGKCP